MEYEEIFEDYDIDPFEVHLLEKEKRFKSMERQKCHKQRLTYEIRHSAGYKPSIGLVGEWKENEYIDEGRVWRGNRSSAQKKMKKITHHRVRKLPTDSLPRKGNRYRRVYDYWWKWF